MAIVRSQLKETVNRSLDMVNSDWFRVSTDMHDGD